MRLPRPLLFPLLLACPLWLAACSQTTTAPQAADEAPPAMRGPAADHAPAGAMEVAAPDAADAPPGDGAAMAPTAMAMAPEGDARQRIERLLGNAAQYEQVFNALKQGVAGNDRAAVARLVRYPLKVTIDGETQQIADAAAFQRQYASIVTAPIARAIAAQSFDNVFANWQGVMIGNGQVWLNGQCQDPACQRSEVRIVTIQP